MWSDKTVVGQPTYVISLVSSNRKCRQLFALTAISNLFGVLLVSDMVRWALDATTWTDFETLTKADLDVLSQTESHPATATATAHPHVSIATPTPRPLSSSPLSPNRGSPAPPCSSSTSAPPAEIEATLTRLSTHQGVLGCLVLSRHDGLVIRSGGQMFDPSGPGAKGRAEMLKSVTKLVKSSVESLAADIRAIDDTVSWEQTKQPCKRYDLAC